MGKAGQPAAPSGPSSKDTPLTLWHTAGIMRFLLRPSLPPFPSFRITIYYMPGTLLLAEDQVLNKVDRTYIWERIQLLLR